MTDDLRTRIAKVLNEAYPQGRYARYHDAVARDLIRELRLSMDRGVIIGCDGNCPTNECICPIWHGG